MIAFPHSASEVTSAWLESSMKMGPIASFDYVPIGTGQVGDTVCITINWAKPDAGPSKIAAKFASTDETSRSTAAAFGLYAREVNFYRKLAPNIDVRTPHVYASELSQDGKDFVLLFEDMNPGHVGNQLEVCTIEEARHCIRQAAALHAQTFMAPWLETASWLKRTPGGDEQFIGLYPHAQAVFQERYDGLLDKDCMNLCVELSKHIDKWVQRKAQRRSVCHSDFRLDNMLFSCHEGCVPVAVVDWQTAEVDCPFKDVAYFLGCGIPSSLRRPHEAEMLDLYCDEMSRRGVAMKRADIWDRYSVGIFHGIVMGVFSAAFVARTQRGDANFLSMVKNSCEMALDNGSMHALQRLKEIDNAH